MMPSLLIVVLVLQLAIHLINTVGAQAINDLLWTLYSKIPNPHSAQMRKQNELRREVVRLKREMNATSSQDEFAKWAKLRRQHDKAVTSYDEMTSNLKSFRTTFDRSVTGLRWVSTNGLRTALQFWYARRPMFWIPRGWVPGYVEWLLAFPKAPRGSVSIWLWGIACATVVQLVGAAVVSGWLLIREWRDKGRKEKIGMKAKSGDREEKKEL